MLGNLEEPVKRNGGESDVGAPRAAPRISHLKLFFRQVLLLLLSP